MGRGGDAALRRVRRDVRERGRTVDMVFEQWFATVRPMHERYVEPARETADMVVSGTEPPEQAVALIQRAIAAML